MAPFDRLYTSSCSSVIVNMSISSAVDIQGGGWGHRYSASNIDVTLKSPLRVVQGH